MTSHHTSMVEIAPSILSADFARLAEESGSRARRRFAAARGRDGRPLCAQHHHRFTRGKSHFPCNPAAPRRASDDCRARASTPNSSLPRARNGFSPYRSRPARAPDAVGHSGCGRTGRIAINPATSLSAVEVLKFADYVLLMSVNPGFGGQKFIPESLDKLWRLRGMIDERGLHADRNRRRH